MTHRNAWRPDASRRGIAFRGRAALLSASLAKAQAWGLAVAFTGLVGQQADAGTDAPPLPPERQIGSASPQMSAAAEPPLPPERTVEGAATGAPSPQSGPTAQPARTPSPEGTDCVSGLNGSGIAVEPAAQPMPGNPACQIDQPVKLVSVGDPGEGGRAVALPAAPVIACRLARPLGEWLSGVVFPVLRAAHGSPVRAVQTGPGSECRSRDRIPGEKLSAHATGLALDIAGFTFADGTTLAIRQDGAGVGDRVADRAALAAARTAACGWFTTILGPGSDAYHQDHLHLDIQQHGSTDRYRICQ